MIKAPVDWLFLDFTASFHQKKPGARPGLVICSGFVLNGRIRDSPVSDPATRLFLRFAYCVQAAGEVRHAASADRQQIRHYTHHHVA